MLEEGRDGGLLLALIKPDKEWTQFSLATGTIDAKARGKSF